jgi:hypothetical protein
MTMVSPVPARDEAGNQSWIRWFSRLRDIVNERRVYTVTINPSSVLANTTSEQTFTATGLRTDDFVCANKPTHTTGLGIVNTRVPANDQIAITFANVTGLAIDAPSETYKLLAVRK